MTNKTILSPSLMAAFYEVEADVKQGYTISKVNPPCMFMNQYCVEMEGEAAIPSNAPATVENPSIAYTKEPALKIPRLGQKGGK